MNQRFTDHIKVIKNHRRELYCLLLLLISALMLRILFLDRESLWIDEAMTATRSRWSYPDMILSIGERDHLPLYYSIMWVWTRVFGFSAISIRSFSAITGSLSVIPLYLIGRRIGKKEGIYIGAVGATLPVLIYFSQEAKMYSLLILLAAISHLLFLEYGEPRIFGKL